MAGVVTVPDIRARKRSRGAEPIVMITAMTCPLHASWTKPRSTSSLSGTPSPKWSSVGSIAVPGSGGGKGGS